MIKLICCLGEAGTDEGEGDTYANPTGGRPGREQPHRRAQPHPTLHRHTAQEHAEQNWTGPGLLDRQAGLYKA